MVSLDVLSIAWTCTPCIVPGRECGVGLDALHPRFGSLPHPREHLLPDHMTRPIPQSELRVTSFLAALPHLVISPPWAWGPSKGGQPSQLTCWVGTKVAPADTVSSGPPSPGLDCRGQLDSKLKAVAGGCWVPEPLGEQGSAIPP